MFDTSSSDLRYIEDLYLYICLCEIKIDVLSLI